MDAESFSAGWLAAVAPSSAAGLVPNVIARSSLFAARTGRGRDGKVVYRKRTLLVAYGACEVWQEGGLQLTQDHLDIWLMLIKASYNLPVSDDGAETVSVSFGYREMLRALGRSSGGADMVWLRDRLTEMRAATYRILCADKLTVTGLIHKFTQERSADGRYEVFLDAGLRRLFSAGWTQLNLTQRLSLSGRTSAHVLAQWLHAFYSTHKSPVPIGAQKLQALCGRAEMETGKFVRLLKDALALLSERVAWRCQYQEGVVSVRKNAAGRRASVPLAAPSTPKAEQSALWPLLTEAEQQAYAGVQAARPEFPATVHLQAILARRDGGKSAFESAYQAYDPDEI